MSFRKPKFRHQRRQSQQRHQRLGAENLEPRLMLDGDGIIWGADARLTLSFAPDGTTVTDSTSTLFAQMDSIAPRREWQSEILRGFQTWAQHTNGDIGLVADSGDDFGVPGRSRHDARFGDIRVGSIPLDDSELYAVSFSTSEVIDGTWAGEILFNSNRTYQNVDEVFAIALHEAGHIFGLEHNDDINSPLHSHGIPESLTPTANDLALLHDVYGMRSPDVYELDEGSNEIVEIELFQTEDGEEGSAPTVVFADLGDQQDTDRYLIEPPSDYSGPITVQLVSSGISQLTPTIRLTTENGSPLATASSTSPGTDVALTLNSSNDEEVYRIIVEKSAENEFAIGGYTLLVWFDGLNEVDPASIQEFIREPVRHIESDELKEYFEDGQVFNVNDDNGDDDSPGSEVVLETIPGFAEGTRYQWFGTMESAVDVDRFRIAAPSETAAGQQWARFNLRALDTSLDMDISIHDSASNEIPTDVLINSDGNIVVQAAINADDQYFVQISTGEFNGVTNGNYEFSAQMGVGAVERTRLTDNLIRSKNDRDRHRLTVQRPQLFHFDLQVDPASAGQPTTELEMIVRDGSGRVFTQLLTGSGDTQTSSAFLPAGSYTVTVRSRNSTGFTNVGYSINATSIDTPLGPQPNNTTDAAFEFDEDTEKLVAMFIFGFFPLR